MNGGLQIFVAFGSTRTKASVIAMVVLATITGLAINCSWGLSVFVFATYCSPHIGVGNMFYEGVSMAACPSVCQDEQLNDQVIRNVEM